MTLSRATAIAGSAVATLASYRMRIVRGHRERPRDGGTMAPGEELTCFTCCARSRQRGLGELSRLSQQPQNAFDNRPGGLRPVPRISRPLVSYGCRRPPKSFRAGRNLCAEL